MDNSISASEFYTSLMAVSIILEAQLTLIDNDTIPKLILTCVTVALVLTFAYKSVKARKECSKKNSDGEQRQL